MSDLISRAALIDEIEDMDSPDDWAVISRSAVVRLIDHAPAAASPALTRSEKCPHCGSDTCPGREDIERCTAIITSPALTREALAAALHFETCALRTVGTRQCKFWWAHIKQADAIIVRLSETPAPTSTREELR